MDVNNKRPVAYEMILNIDTLAQTKRVCRPSIFLIIS